MAMVITPTLTIIEYPNINIAFPSTTGECVQGFYAKVDVAITGIDIADSFGIDFGVNITPLAPLIYSRWTYMEDYAILLTDNIAWQNSGIDGFRGANQSFDLVFGSPYPNIAGLTSGSDMAFVFFGNTTDLTSSAVIAKYNTGTNGQNGVFMNLPSGREFTLTPYYRIYRTFDGYGPKIPFASASVSVPVLPCEEGGGGGGNRWERREVEGGTFTRRCVSGGTFTRRCVSGGTFTRRDVE